MKGRARIGTAPRPRSSDGDPGLDAERDGLRRRGDTFLERSLLGELAALGAESGFLRRLPALLGALAEADLAAGIEGLFSALRDLESRRDDLAARLNALSRRVDGLREALNGDVCLAVGDINRCASQLAGLNGRVDAAAGEAPVRERRRILLRELGERLAISAVETSRGDVNVLAGGDFLVVGGEAAALEAGGDGVLPVFASGGAALAVRGGALRGLLEARDVLLAGVARDLDRLAGSLALAGHPESFTALRDLPSIARVRGLSERLEGEAAAARGRRETRALLVRQIENRRERAWKAGFDEEVARLMREQRAAEASARCVDVIEDLLGPLRTGI